MSDWQYVFIVLWGIFALLGFFWALSQSQKGNSYGELGAFRVYGAFVVGDMVVFGIFWFGVSLVSLYLGDWLLFWLIFFIFWTIRSLGETIYWFLQQFSTIQREPPKKWWHYKIFKNDSVWYINQIFFQCLTIISIVSSIYFAHKWLQTLA